MPIQPPSDRTRTKGGHSSPEFWILTSGFSPIMQNEPNLRLPACPKPQIRETNPIPPATRLWKTKKCETNPIYAYPSLANHPKMRNEPNSHIPTVPPPPISAKRTQSQDAPRPNAQNEPNLPHHYHPADPNMRNEPNYRLANSRNEPNLPHRGRHSCTKVPVPGGKIFAFHPIIGGLTARGAGVATFFEKS